MPPDSPQPLPRPPHPLALELIDRLRDRAGAAVLEIGAGSGRNTRALRDAGFSVVVLDDDVTVAAALSTHALLHGTRASIAATLARIARRVEPHGALFITLGSMRDARYGRGTFIEERVYAPEDGDERGVPHAYFDEPGVRELLNHDWMLESLRETDVDAIAGSWAHQQAPLHDAVHWFVVATRRSGT